MAELSDAQIDAALDRGRIVAAEEPRALRARYVPSSDRVIVDLANGCTFAFPPTLVEGLETATFDQLAGIELSGTGYGLHWTLLDVDISVPGLLAGIFGTRTHMARLAGRAKSVAKARAARINGAKGGRPRKVAPAKG